MRPACAPSCFCTTCHQSKAPLLNALAAMPLRRQGAGALRARFARRCAPGPCLLGAGGPDSSARSFCRLLYRRQYLSIQMQLGNKYPDDPVTVIPSGELIVALLPILSVRNSGGGALAAQLCMPW